MSNLTITPTGYYSTGSSAVFYLLKEYRTVTTGVFDKKDKEIEHFPLYIPSGLFDLEDKLLIGNNIQRSDEALAEFYRTMNDLYSNNYQWYGNYKKYFGTEFMIAVNALIDELTEFKSTAKWYYDQEMRFSFKHTIRSILNLLTKEPINANFFQHIAYKKKYNDGLTRYAFPTKSEYYEAARKFIRAYINMAKGGSEGILVLDHFILPHNIFRIYRYLSEEELRIIVVDRDIRDVYIDVRERMEYHNVASPVPVGIEDYAKFMRKVRETETKENDGKQVLRIFYEDLFYNYEETVSVIENFCGLSAADHVNKGKYFNPAEKRRYTKLYTNSDKYNREVKYLEEEMPEYTWKGL